MNTKKKRYTREEAYNTMSIVMGEGYDEELDSYTTWSSQYARMLQSLLCRRQIRPCEAVRSLNKVLGEVRY